MISTLEYAIKQSPNGLRANIVFTDDERSEGATILGYDNLGIAVAHRKSDVMAALIPWTAIFQLELLHG